jgi:predicted RND superfamily exporter protein
VRRILASVTDYPWIVLLGVTLLTVFLVSRLVDFETGEAQLRLDSSVDRLLPQGDEDQAFYKEVRRVFGSDETILIALVDDEAFTPENLAVVMRLTDRIKRLDGIHHVVSLSTALNIRDVDGDLEIEPFLMEVPESEAELERIRREALDNPIYAGNLVSYSGRALVLLVYFLDLTEEQFAEVDREILEIVDEERANAVLHVTGAPHIKVATANILVSDLSLMLPMIFGLVAVVAGIAFRTIRGALIPVTGIAIAILWTLGLLAWLGQSLNLVTLIVPPLVLTIGFAYVIHILTAYNEALRGEASGEDGEESAASEALNEVALPVVLTALTTIAGFLAMALSPIGAIREVGLFSALGVAATAVVSLTFAPALLEILPDSKRVTGSDDSAFDAIAERVGLFSVVHRRGIIFVTTTVTVIAILAIGLIEVNNALISDFPRSHPVRADFETINEELGGSNPLYVVIEADYAGAFKEPAVLAKVQELQEWLAAQPEIGGSTSLVDYLMLLNRGFHGNDPDYLVIPKNKRLATQLLFFGGSDEIESFADSRYQRINVLVRSNVIDSGALLDLVRRIEARVEELPDFMRATVTGNTVLVARTIDDIAAGQAVSLGLAFVLIYAILAALFTSFRMGLIALVPNVIPVAVYFGAIGLSDVDLNSMNGLVACIVLGIAVDDTIHYLVRFNVEARRMADAKRGAVEALRNVGRPVTYTTVALALGFLIFTTAEMNNWVEFGALGALTLVVAWLVDVTFLPALVSGLRIVTLWDVLTLDLGEDAHLAIPMFRGLSPRQARIAALTARIEEYPPGQRLFSAGDKGQVMYVVIDGELEASLERGRERAVFTRMRRGDVVGEVALFNGERTADVDTVSDVRLMRLTEADLERIRTRSPRIAAILLQNLGRTLADRVASTVSTLR